MYRNPDDFQKRRITLWLLRHFHERLQSHKDDPAWLDLTEALRRLLDSSAWQVREPNDRDFVVGDGWVAVGPRMEPCLMEDLVDAANLLVQVAGRGHREEAPPSGRSPQEPTPANTPPMPPDGPEGGRWEWVSGKRHDVKTGVVYRMIAFMWDGSSAGYDTLEGGNVFEDRVTPGTIRARVSDVNRCLRKIGVSWRLKPNSESRCLTKQSAS